MDLTSVALDLERLKETQMTFREAVTKLNSDPPTRKSAQSVQDQMTKAKLTWRRLRRELELQPQAGD